MKQLFFFIALVSLMGRACGAAETVVEEEKRVSLPTNHFIELIDKYLKAIHAGELEKAYSAFTTFDFRKATSFVLFREFVSKYAGFTRQSLKGVTFQNDDCSVLHGNFRIQSSGDILTVEYVLAREGKTWKINKILIDAEKPPAESKPLGNKPAVKKKKIQGGLRERPLVD